MDNVISIISIIIAIIGLLFSSLGIIHNRFLAVDKFLTVIESDDFIKAKKYIYNYDGEFNVDDEYAAMIVNFFHHWGMLVKKHYLPLWVFDNATGKGMCRLFKKTKNYIMIRRKYNNDSTYGEYFEWLNKKIETRFKKSKKF